MEIVQNIIGFKMNLTVKLQSITLTAHCNYLKYTNKRGTKTLNEYFHTMDDSLFDGNQINHSSK